jgi:hypothetical protein
VAERGESEKEIRPQTLEGDVFFVFLWSDEFVGNRNSGEEPRRRKTTCGEVCSSFSGENEFCDPQTIFFGYRFVVSDTVGNRVYSDFGFQDADAESPGKEELEGCRKDKD